MATVRAHDGIRSPIAVGVSLAAAGMMWMAGCGGEPGGVASSSNGLTETQSADTVQGKADVADAQPAKVHLRKGQKKGGGGSALMTWHHGAVLVANTTTAIFWGSEWTNTTFAGDKITGLGAFFEGFGGSGYADD